MLCQQVISEQQRARDEAEKKVHALSRRMDHLERARREEEAPLLEAAFQEKVRPTLHLRCSMPLSYSCARMQ
jgi:translation initiation factor 3 subunit A